MSWSDVFLIMRGLPWTLVLTTGSFLIGAVLGLPLLLAYRSSWAVVRIATLIFILIIRGIPPLVWLFAIFFGLGVGFITISPLGAAWMAFGLIATANMAEIYRGAMVAIPRGQFEATMALNLSRWHTFVDVIGPQAFRVALPSTASYVIGLMKDTAIASTIGVTELTFRGYQLSQVTFRGLEIYAIVAGFYILLSIPIAWLSRAVDTQLRERVAR